MPGLVHIPLFQPIEWYHLHLESVERSKELRDIIEEIRMKTRRSRR
jgi:hypothetical protein